VSSDIDKAVDKAIATIEDSRKTHVEWRDFLNRHPDHPHVKSVGDSQHHIQCIAEYDNVLKVLRSIKEANDGS
jgi:hypothetical protein